MKKLLLILLFIPIIGFGQDALLFQDGSKKDVTVLEITPTIVKYKKFNSSSEVIYTEDKKTLLGVVFEDGEFEKFESRRGGSGSNVNKGDFGNNMIYFSPILPFVGYIGIGYERFSKSGKSSIRIPLQIQFNQNNISSGMFYSGFEYKFFPAGNSGGVKGFVGFEERIGEIIYIGYSNYYGYRSEFYLFNETNLTGGVQFHASELIYITLDGRVGIGLLDFADPYLSYQIGLNLGFRF